jgi:glyoxylase-like metal-dependent hydrolase (beta-lactamase superfamily II)
MQQIERGIFYENSFLGVTLGGLVFSHGTILIDAPLRAEDARSWRSSLLNQRGGASRLLINLDAHPDRTLGARAMDCTIVAHQKAAQVFRNRPSIFKGQGMETGADWELYNDAIGMRWAPPDITFSQQMSMHWGGLDVILEHHPGPAPGSIWVVIPNSRIIFIGDAVVSDQPPFLANADPEAWLETLDLLHASYRDYVLISGRGGPLPADAVQKQKKYLKNILKGLDRLTKRNAPPEDVDDLIPGLLSDLTFPAEKKERYRQRLRYGLYQYYARRFRPASALEQYSLEDDDQ